MRRYALVPFVLLAVLGCDGEKPIEENAKRATAAKTPDVIRGITLDEKWRPELIVVRRDPYGK